MKKLLILPLLLGLIFSFGGRVLAQQDEAIDVVSDDFDLAAVVQTIVPQKPAFYDQWFEQIQLLFANKFKKVELRVKFAEKRLAVLDYLEQANKLTKDQAEKLRTQYQELIDKAQSDLDKLPNGQQLKDLIKKFQDQLERHNANFLRIIAKAPDAAKSALQKALNASIKGKTRLIKKLQSLPSLPEKTATPEAKTQTVEINKNGFSPARVIIKVGDSVKFVNRDSAPHQPASNPHPTHTICSGFDALHGLDKNESYSYTFTVAKECPYHDHLNPFNSNFSGKVVVQP